MSVLEKRIEYRVVQFAKSLLIPVTKLNLAGQRGWPDRCFWIDGGQPLLVEFKRKGKLPTPLQQHTIDLLLDRGYQVAICDTYEEAEKIIRAAIAAAARRN